MARALERRNTGMQKQIDSTDKERDTSQTSKNNNAEKPTTGGGEGATAGGDSTDGKKDIAEYLESIYYDPLHPGSYGGLQKFWSAIKADNHYNLTHKQVSAWLKQQEAFVRHQAPPKVYPRQKILMSSMDEQWDGDLLSMIQFAKKNNGYKYLAVFIDIFSRYIWVEPMKTKTGGEMVQVLARIFKKGRKPLNLRTDRGTEYTNNIVQHYLKRQGTHHFVAYNPIHASYAERVIRTLKGKLYRFFTDRQTHRYIDYLGDIVDGYLNTVHNTTEMRPIDITDKNSQDVYEKLYLPQQLAEERKPVKYKFEIADKVYLLMDRGTFNKGYKETYFQEIFEIIRRTPTHPPRYKIVDLLKEEIRGSFYEQQLVKVTYNVNELFRIEKVLRYRKTDKGKEALVRWQGYPPKFDRWISVDELVDYV
jgi:hypothetical protein